MNKKMKPLIVLCVLLALLIGVYALVVVLADESEEDSMNETEASVYNVCAVDKNTVSRITYTLDGEEYVYALNADATGWVWAGDATLPLDNTYFASIVTACEALTSTVRLTEVTPAELKDYGLDETAVRFSFTDAAGVKSYRLGAYNSFNGKCYFADEAVPNVVYMVDSTVGKAFLFTPYDMIKMPDLPTDITPANLVRLSLTPSAGSAEGPMVYTYYVGGKAEGETDAWYVSADGGEEVRLSDEEGKSLSTALSTMAFSSLASYRAEEQGSFGLDAASATVMVIDYKVTQSFKDETTGKVTNVNVDRSFSLLLGGVNASGQRYATVEGSPLSCVLVGEVFGDLGKAR